MNGWRTASPAARARAQATKNARRTARRNYMRDVLHAPNHIIQFAQHSVLAMKVAFPGHEFPPELVKRHLPGRVPRG